MTRDIVIIGCGGLGRSIASLIDQTNANLVGLPLWNIIGFLDDAPATADLERVSNRGNRVLGGVRVGCASLAGVEYVVGIGNGAVREKLSLIADEAGLKPATLVHHRANVGAGVSMGAGAVVCAGATIDPDVTIGRHVLINKNSVTGHDAVLDDFVSIGPLAVVGGGNRVGQRSTFGMHAMTIPELVVGADATLGAAACAVKDVPAGTTVKGVPAR